MSTNCEGDSLNILSSGKCLKRALEHFREFESVRNDPEFLTIVNASVIAPKFQ